jgi:calcium-dependent protein kinase
LDFEVAVVGGGGEEEADILITVEKRRPERNLLGFESFGEENLVGAISYFDKAGSGYITIDELQQACTEFGLCDTPLDDMIKEIDLDNDGKIDFSEFTAMMKKGDGVGRSRTMRNNLNFNIAEAFGVEDTSSTAKSDDSPK